MILTVTALESAQQSGPSGAPLTYLAAQLMMSEGCFGRRLNHHNFLQTSSTVVFCSALAEAGQRTGLPPTCAACRGCRGTPRARCWHTRAPRSPSTGPPFLAIRPPITGGPSSSWAAPSRSATLLSTRTPPPPLAVPTMEPLWCALLLLCTVHACGHVVRTPVCPPSTPGHVHKFI